MPFAATWMDLETIILSEVKDKYHMIPLKTWILKKNNINRIYGYPKGKQGCGMN